MTSFEDVLDDDAVVLAGSARTRDDAIREAGALLVGSGAVDAPYVEAMIEREQSASTHMGSGLAIPHGTNAAKSAIRRTGLSFVRHADPGAGDDHVELLAQLAGVFVDDDQVQRLRAADSPAAVREVLAEG